MRWQTFRLTLPIVAAAWFLLRVGLSSGQVTEPIFRLEAGGPTSYVTSLAFSPDGQTLYVAGFDKVVQVWRQNASGRFELDARATIRVPIGPGQGGAINALALSPDGRWLAVGGRSILQGEPGFQHAGRVFPSSIRTSEMKQDLGRIFVFDTFTGEARTLRGHEGEVVALTFAPQEGDRPPLLISAGRELGEPDRGRLIAWNLADSIIHRSTSLPWPPQFLRPHLTAWQSDRRVCAAVAWPPQRQPGATENESYLGVWDLQGRGRLVQAPEVGLYSNTVGFYGKDQFLAGNLHESLGGGYLRIWQYQQPAGRLAPAWTYTFPSRNSVHAQPRDLTLCASRPGGSLDTTAVVLARFGPNHPVRHELHLIDMTRGRAVAQIDLGRPVRVDSAPVIAAGPTHLAIAGFGDHVVRVYRTADLLAQRNAPQLLQSVGVTLTHVTFAESADKTALLLREAGSTAADWDLVFDLQARVLSPYRPDGPWRPSAPAAASWSAEVANNQLVIREAGRVVSQIAPPPQHTITAHALLAGHDPPLAALATLGPGEVLIQLHNARSGEGVRQLTAHTLPVRSLAFSSDGSLLASAGEDQFACVWNLADLVEVLQRYGTNRDVTVQQQNDALVVAQVKTANLGLSVGDVILGRLQDDGGVHAWRSLRDFYEAFWTTAPGETLRVQVQAASGATREVALRSQQAMDERKPLFSLFVFRSRPGDLPDQRRWIGWSPSGHFDMSDQHAEQHLGWHFNRSEEESPTSFADAGEYRDRFYAPGLFEYLLENREPPLAMDLPHQQPLLVLSFPEDPELTIREPVQLRSDLQQVRLDITGYPVDRIRSVKLQLDGKEIASFIPERDFSWVATLPAGTWTPGSHRLEAVLEAGGQVYTEQLAIEYQPEVVTEPPPQALAGIVRITSPPDGATLSSPGREAASGEFTALLSIPDDAVPFTVELSHNDRPLETKPNLTPTGHVTSQVPLLRGQNHFTLTLRRQDNSEVIQSATSTVYLNRPPRVLPLEQPELGMDPFVSLVAFIESETALTQVLVNGRPVPEQQIVEDASRGAWRVQVPRVPLREGRNRLELEAWNADGRAESPAPIELTYTPPAPLPSPPLVLISPADDTPTTQASGEVQINVRSELPLTDVVLLQNNREVYRAQPTGTEFREVLPVSLEPGPNQFTVLASNTTMSAAPVRVTVTRIEVPVDIHLESLVSSTPQGEQLQRPSSRSGSQVQFSEPAHDWNPTLHGYVQWHEEDPQLDASLLRMQVWVNGFQQLPVFLEPREAGTRKRRFSVPIILSRQAGNRIELRLTEVKNSDSSKLNFFVDCARPRSEQRLHLLVIGVGVPEERKKELVEKVLRGLDVQVNSQAGPELATDAFAYVRVYGPLVGNDLTDAHVFYQLNRIQQQINRLSVGEQQNDVVMVYYQGGELVEKGEEFFLTMRDVDETDAQLSLAALRRRHLSSNDLAQVIHQIRGAHVLLLDVARQPKARRTSAQMPGDSHAAVLRYAWLADTELRESQNLAAALDTASTAPQVDLSIVRDAISATYQRITERYPDVLSFEQYIPDPLLELTLAQ